MRGAGFKGTAGVQLAAGLLASHMVSPKAKALVITTDQSRMHLGKPYEFVMGAGAAAKHSRSCHHGRSPLGGCSMCKSC